jgi:hypothetical protein
VENEWVVLLLDLRLEKNNSMVEMSAITPIIHWMSIILPFSNEIAITLTHSGIPLFKKLYRSCIDTFSISDNAIRKKVENQICNLHDSYHKIFFDTIAYFGIMLNICKNAIQYGYVTGIFSGLNLVIWSMLLTNMFLGPAIHYVSHLFHVKSPIMYILVGISLIALLIVITHYTELWVQHITQKVVVDIDLDKI